MREIKFRVYHEIAKDMLYFGLGEDKLPAMSESGDAYTFYLIDNYPIMQYTGLKDKKGTEIYEGDIVADTPRFMDVPCHGILDTAEKVAMEEIQGSDDMGVDCIGYPLYWQDFIVIGNIYENPELLENTPRK